MSVPRELHGNFQTDMNCTAGTTCRYMADLLTAEVVVFFNLLLISLFMQTKYILPLVHDSHKDLTIRTTRL